MRPLVAREQEQISLRKAAAQTPSLIVLIGRRRVGKSFLLAHTMTAERTVSFQGDEQGERQHLGLLAAETGRVLLGSPALSFDTWDAALAFFGNQARLAPLTVILDEFQWLKSAQPALDSIIQRHWDRWDREGVPLTLVLAGSALTMMERLLERGAPLFGRATSRPRLQPLDYREAAGFVDASDPEFLLRRWAVLGGTPQYQLWAGEGDIETIITERILAKDTPLYDEPRHLLREGEGIRDAGTYLSILRAIAGGATQHNDIAQKGGVPTGNLVRKLDRLEDLGYIAPRYPVELDGVSRRVTYQLSDPYFRFWFRYVANNRSRLERGRTAEVATEILADFDSVMGWAFEECCRRWLGRYASEQAFGVAEEVGSWWSRDGRTEIDVAAVHRQRYTVIGECKWRKLVDADVLGKLRKKQVALGPKATDARLVIFGRQEFGAQLIDQADPEHVTLVTAEDLFRG